MDLIGLAVLALIISFELCDANNKNTSKPNSRRTHELVDEAFLEQKDVLLEMLESKLKEVKGKKKKRTLDPINIGSKFDQLLPKNGELKMVASGISAVGEIEAQIGFGETGKGILKLNAVGISNVGRSHLDLGLGSNVPGISGLFMGNLFGNNSAKAINNTVNELKILPTTTLDNRRKLETSNNTINVTETEVTNDSNDINVTPIEENINETPNETQ